MHLLVDECLPTGVTSLLRAAGHDVLDPRDSLLRCAPDEMPLARAINERRVLIPCDVALGTKALAAMEGGDSVGPVLVRFPPNTSVSRLCSVVVDAVAASDVAAIGTLAVLSPHKVRIRAVPRRGE